MPNEKNEPCVICGNKSDHGFEKDGNAFRLCDDCYIFIGDDYSDTYDLMTYERAMEQGADSRDP